MSYTNIHNLYRRSTYFLNKDYVNGRTWIRQNIHIMKHSRNTAWISVTWIWQDHKFVSKFLNYQHITYSTKYAMQWFDYFYSILLMTSSQLRKITLSQVPNHPFTHMLVLNHIIISPFIYHIVHNIVK